MLSDYLKTLPQFIAPKKSLTHIAGLLANIKKSFIKNWLINRFIAIYGVNMKEALQENPKNYACFNDFFIRHLKPECRPLAEADIISPVDGFISEIGCMAEGQVLQAKGRYYSVEELLASESSLAQKFSEGCFATLYLSPKDYHRIHMPIDGRLTSMIYVPGKLFSVQPATTKIIPHLFARNERVVSFFETELGLMAMVLVGATIVGSITTSWEGELKRAKQKQYFNYPGKPTLQKGQEMGYFKLGSTVVLLFAEGQRMAWLDNLKPGLPIRLGQAFGEILV